MFFAKYRRQRAQKQATSKRQVQPQPKLIPREIDFNQEAFYQEEIISEKRMQRNDKVNKNPFIPSLINCSYKKNKGKSSETSINKLSFQTSQNVSRKTFSVKTTKKQKQREDKQQFRNTLSNRISTIDVKNTNKNEKKPRCITLGSDKQNEVIEAGGMTVCGEKAPRSETMDRFRLKTARATEKIKFSNQKILKSLNQYP